MSVTSQVISALGGSANTSASTLTDVRASVDARYGKASESELAQWLSLAKTVSAADFASLDAAVATKSYLAGGVFGIADAALFIGLATCKDAAGVAKHSNLQRYVSHVQCLCKAQSDVKPFPTTVANTPVPIGCGTAVKADSKAVSAVPAAAAAAGAAGGEKEKKEKKEKPAAAAATAAPAAGADKEEPLEPSLLDIRVGVIVKCWNHPDSEKLLCEEVDCGEAAPRNIASGIRAFYNADEFVGKKVMVLANLKARAVAGFKSEGMVLCACNDDHSKVAILEPPADAMPGDKVEFAGFEGKEAAQPNAVAKKKILEKLAPLLKTDATGAAFTGKDQWLINGKAVTSAMCSATIS